MKINKFFIGFGTTVLILLFFIFTNVLASSSDKEIISKETKEWKLGKQDLKQGGKPEPKPKKNLQLKIQTYGTDESFTQNDNGIEGPKTSLEKSDTLK